MPPPRPNASQGIPDFLAPTSRRDQRPTRGTPTSGHAEHLQRRLPRRELRAQGQLRRPKGQPSRKRWPVKMGLAGSRPPTQGPRVVFFLFWAAASSRYVVRRDWSRARAGVAPPKIPARLSSSRTCLSGRAAGRACCVGGRNRGAAFGWCIWLETCHPSKLGLVKKPFMPCTKAPKKSNAGSAKDNCLLERPPGLATRRTRPPKSP